MEGEQMAEQPTDQNPLQGEQMYTPPKKGISAGLVVLIVVLAMGVSGAGAYYYVNNKAKTEKNNLQNQISDLEKEVATLKATETTTSTTAPTSATTDATKDWKTYTNTKYLYSFKYPADFTLEEAGIGGTSATPTSDDIYVGDSKHGQMEVITSNSETKTLDQLVGVVTAISDSGAYTVTDDKLGGEPAKKIEVKQKTGINLFNGTGQQTAENSENIYLVKKSNVAIQIIIGLSGWKQIESTYNQILSTFQFTS